MKRREFIILVGGGAVALPIGARAQRQKGKVHRIGYLSPGTVNPRLANLRPLEAFRQGLRELGWVEGHNIVIEYRYADGQYDRLPGLADELVRLNVDLIAAALTPAVLAAKKATGTIPIVGISFVNPVQHGLVASLAHPGGNVTGLSYSIGPEIFGKDLELLREVVPESRHFAVLSNPSGPNHAPIISSIKTAAQSMGVQLLLLEARGPDEFDGAFAAMAKARVGALLVVGDPAFDIHRTRIAELVLENRLPSMHTLRQSVEAGGLMSYGPSVSDIWRRAATYVDKILKGAKPGDLPVEQPTKFELVINLKTAKALGLAIPQSILLRADEIIE